MQPHRQDAHSLQQRVFHYSLDWRFLIPTAEAASIYVLFEPDADFSQTLERVGIPASNQLSFSDLEQSRNHYIQSLVLPFGLPLGLAMAKPEEQSAFYASCRHLIVAGGSFLVGFDSIWKWRANANSKYYSSTPRRIADQLHRAGFQSIKVFGALPNLTIPEYIFDLDSRAIHFALQNRFRRQPAVLKALRVLAGTIGLARFSNLMPSYFAVTTA